MPLSANFFEVSNPIPLFAPEINATFVINIPFYKLRKLIRLNKFNVNYIIVNSNLEFINNIYEINVKVLLVNFKQNHNK